MRLTLVTMLCVLLVGGVPAGCSSDGDNTGTGGSGSDAAASTGDATVGAGDDAAGPDASGSGSTDPGAAPVDVCPAGFIDAAPEGGQHTGYEVTGQQRSFWLALPDADTHSGPRPLLVEFNGTGGTGLGFFGSTTSQDFVDRGFIVVGPDSNSNGSVWPVWDGMHQVDEVEEPNPDLDLFDSLVACLSAHHAIDADRIYVAGHSAGGIMSNYVLQRRSDMLAGGIVASGVLSLTEPEPAAPLEGMAVVVTWGGDNDAYSGTADDGQTDVPEINFVEQASLASLYYEGEAAVNQIHCRGADVGHAWLDDVNGFMADFLLAHPKGSATSSDWAFEAPAGATTCSEDAYEYVPLVSVECPSAGQTGCGDFCQLLADCGVENGTVSAVLGPQIEAAGFAGDDFSDCTGCETLCGEDAAAGGAADEPVLTCFSDAFSNAECGPGVQGAAPFIQAVNTCCDGAADSGVCGRICTNLMSNSVASQFFPSCEPWGPQE